jgi:hypothetical protein
MAPHESVNMLAVMNDDAALTPAAVLKAIRDQTATTPDELYKMFSHWSYRSVHRMSKILGDLVSDGLVSLSNGKYSVTDHWISIQGTLEISLTTLVETSRPSVLSVAPVFGLPDESRPVPDVFVLMSFGAEFTPVYKDHITNAVGSLGLKVGRADDFFTAHSVMRDVWTAVYRSRVVIADCTSRNPNVFYEIGMAHTAGKPVILVTQSEADVPFDLRPLRYIKYEYTPPGMRQFETRLTQTIREVLRLELPPKAQQPGRSKRREKAEKLRED